MENLFLCLCAKAHYERKAGMPVPRSRNNVLVGQTFLSVQVYQFHHLDRQECLSYEKAGAELVEASCTRAHLFANR
jgi:hypothetical protein